MSDFPPDLASVLADRYELLRELGAGGMATVCLARDVRHNRQVALKVLLPELSAVLGPERGRGLASLEPRRAHALLSPGGPRDRSRYCVCDR